MTFESRLDRLWKDQPLYYTYKECIQNYPTGHGHEHDLSRDSSFEMTVEEPVVIRRSVSISEISLKGALKTISSSSSLRYIANPVIYLSIYLFIYLVSLFIYLFILTVRASSNLFPEYLFVSEISFIGYTGYFLRACL